VNARKLVETRTNAKSTGTQNPTEKRLRLTVVDEALGDRRERGGRFTQPAAGAVTMVRDRGFEPLTPTVSR
jgi:hypothetical protein